jgi:asparagine synthase (glutamine-hydrolysing)
MCGLVSIFAYAANAPAVNQTELLTIRDHMLARGPDGCGAWLSADGRVGLGHRRLAIIDTSDDGLQPMLASNGQVRIVFNGEIYNYRELRAQLLAKGHTFRSQSDTEVLLAGWLEWGEQLVSHLRGMFAFALWDEDKQGLFLARDTFGIKPLYIANDGKTLRCASQVKALLAGGNVDTTPNPAGHVGFFCGEACQSRTPCIEASGNFLRVLHCG